MIKDNNIKESLNSNQVNNIDNEIKNAMAIKANETEFGDIYSFKTQNLLKELNEKLK